MQRATPQRFSELCLSVGVSGDIVTDAWHELLLHYSEPQRFYHNLYHIDRMLYWLDLDLERHVTIEFAIWYHDVIYDPRSAMNESLSANFFHSGLGTHISPELASDIGRLILATDHRRLLCQAEDESTIIDIDLSILGEHQEVYDAYARNIRREYAHVSDAAYAEGRKKVLSGFLDRTIFTSPPFRNFESIARDNILREIATLTLKQCEQD